MSTQETPIAWSGASKTQYKYYSRKLPYTCDAGKDGKDGNYIFTKVVDNVWVPIYIGQGDLNHRVNDPDHYKCATGKGATHVHLHLNAREVDRLAEEQDLLLGHPSAYAPTGCNVKVGG